VKVDNQTTRNARKRGEITQEQARNLLEAAEQVLWQIGVTRQDFTSRMLQAAISEIRGE
jgi:hypothetical protein